MHCQKDSACRSKMTSRRGRMRQGLIQAVPGCRAGVRREKHRLEAIATSKAAARPACGHARNGRTAETEGGFRGNDFHLDPRLHGLHHVTRLRCQDKAIFLASRAPVRLELQSPTWRKREKTSADCHNPYRRAK